MDFTVTITPLNGHEASIQVASPVSVEMLAATSCLAAVPTLDGVAEIGKISLINSANGREIYEFTANPVTGGSVQDALFEAGAYDLADREWVGFMATTPVAVPDGLATHMEMRVTLEPGKNLADLVRAVKEQAMVAGSAAPDGSLDEHHYWVRAFKHANVQIGRSKSTKVERPLPRPFETNTLRITPSNLFDNIIQCSWTCLDGRTGSAEVNTEQQCYDACEGACGGRCGPAKEVSDSV